GVDVDCPDVGPMIRFYIGLTGMEYRAPAGEYPKLVGENGLLYLFQQVEEEYLPPTWPTQERGQQMHIDYLVDDLDNAGRQAGALGASGVDREPGWYFVVMVGPSGYPFFVWYRG